MTDNKIIRNDECNYLSIIQSQSEIKKKSNKMQNNDLYSQQFDDSGLQNIYLYFNQILGNPEPRCTQEDILNQSLTNQRQKLIKMDCLRTRFSSFTQQIKDQLQIVLTHYCRINDMEYKQGLNQLAAPFLYFRILKIPLSKCQSLFGKFYRTYSLNFLDSNNFISVQFFIKMLSGILKYHDPALSRYLSWYQIQPQLFCANWLLTLFASKLSLKLVYLLWMYLAAQKDQFFLLFLVLAIVEINRQNIIQSKNNNVLQVLTHLIFQDIYSLKSVVERALLIRKNTPSSIVLFFKDRAIFDQRQDCTDIIQLIEHMEQFSLFVMFPGEITLDRHLSEGPCQNQCYFCHLNQPIPITKQSGCQQLTQLIDISNDIRVMKYRKQYVIMDLRIDQSNEILHNGTVFKINRQQTMESVQYRFMTQFMEEKGRKHFIIVLTYFKFEQLSVCISQELERCKKIINILNSSSFPLISILEGGIETYLQQIAIKPQKLKTMQTMIDNSIYLCSYQLPYSFPLKISDRCRLATALCNDEAIIFIGIVEVIIIFDYFIFILPTQKQLLSFVNYFQHNKSVIQYLYEKPHIPAELLVHKVISIRSLKKASMKIHNQNILVLLYDSCWHQERRIFQKLSKYLEMDIASFWKIGQICAKCQKKKKKIILEMNQNQSVKDCLAVLTSKYMQIRKKFQNNSQALMML